MHDHCGVWYRVARGDEGNLGVFHLIDRVAPELAHGFDSVLHSMNVTLREITATGIEGQRTVRPQQLAIRHEWPSFTPLAKTQFLEGHQDQRRKVVVNETDIDILVGNAG